MRRACSLGCLQECASLHERISLKPWRPSKLGTRIEREKSAVGAFFSTSAPASLQDPQLGPSRPLGAIPRLKVWQFVNSFPPDGFIARVSGHPSLENGDEQDHALVNVPDDSCRPYAVGRLSGFIASSILEAGPSVSEIACFGGQRNEAHIRGKADALFSTMKLLNADGSVMAEMTPPKASPEMAMSTPTLSPGTYLVEHRVLTTDGDVVKGDFFFTVDDDQTSARATKRAPCLSKALSRECP
jgi:copper resistance protein C